MEYLYQNSFIPLAPKGTRTTVSARLEEPKITERQMWEKLETEIYSAMVSGKQIDESYDPLDINALNSSLMLIDNLRSVEEGATKLPPPSRLVFSPAGGVALEWQIFDVYIEAEINEPGVAEWMIESPGEPARHYREEISRPKSWEGASDVGSGTYGTTQDVA